MSVYDAELATHQALRDRTRVRHDLGIGTIGKESLPNQKGVEQDCCRSA
jgi:hypothetical protein